MLLVQRDLRVRKPLGHCARERPVGRTASLGQVPKGHQGRGRVPGRLCLLCCNVYSLLGLKHKWGSYKQYAERVVKQKAADHGQFMASLTKWVSDHNRNPQRRRVAEPSAVAKAKVKIKSETALGLRIKQNREFVPKEEWDESKDGVWDDAKVQELEIAGKVVRGIFKAPKRYKVEEYVDSSNRESRLEEDSSRTCFAEEALSNAREAVNSSWQEAKAARDAASVEGPKSADLSDVLKMLDGVSGAAELVERGKAAASSQAPLAVSVKAEEAQEEEEESSEEEDLGVSSASRLAARFGAPKAKAAVQSAAAKAKPKAKGKAAPAPSTAGPSQPDNNTTAAPEAKAAGRVVVEAAARAELPLLCPVKKEPQESLKEPAAAAVLVLDGRGQRLQESIRKHLADVARQLESVTLANVEDAKERKSRAKVLSQVTTALKTQSKRVQESANKAALQVEEEELATMTEVATAASTAFAAGNSTNPDPDQLQKACQVLRASRLSMIVDSSIYAKLISAKASQSCLFRQYREMCCHFDPGDPVHGQEISQLLLLWTKAQVENWALTDMSHRLSSILRNIPLSDVGKTDSDAKEQFGLLCQAMEQSKENQLVERVLSQVRLAHALVFPGKDLQACRQAVVRVDDFAKLAEGARCQDNADEEARAMLQFFVEHRLGITLLSAAREKVKSGEGERVLQQMQGELATMLATLSDIQDLDRAALVQRIEPTWLKIAEAKEKAKTAHHRVALEQSTKQFLDWLLLKVTTESQEEVLGFLEYVTLALRDNGMAVPLDADADAAPALLDFVATAREMNHVQGLMTPFFDKLGKAGQRPKELDERLEKESFVRKHLRGFAGYVFQKCVPGICPDAGVATADSMTFWTSELPVALAELLPESPSSLRTQQDFFHTFSPAVLTELQGLALKAYHEVGDLVQLVVHGKSNESVAAATIDKLTMEMPKDCSLRPVWMAFFQVARKNHELRAKVSDDFGKHLAASRDLLKALQKHEAALKSSPEKACAMRLLEPECQEWLRATLELSRQLLRHSLAERVEAVKKVGVVTLRALQQLPHPHIDEVSYRTALSQHAQSWASASQAARCNADALQSACGQLTDNDPDGGDAAFETDAVRVAQSVQAAAKLLAAHVTFFAGLTLLRSTSSGAKSAEGKSVSKKIDTLLAGFWRSSWPETPFSEALPSGYVQQVLLEMIAAVDRSVGKCSVTITEAQWEQCEEARSRLHCLGKPRDELAKLQKISPRSALPDPPAGKSAEGSDMPPASMASSCEAEQGPGAASKETAAAAAAAEAPSPQLALRDAPDQEAPRTNEALAAPAGAVSTTVPEVTDDAAPASENLPRCTGAPPPVPAAEKRKLPQDAAASDASKIARSAFDGEAPHEIDRAVRSSGQDGVKAKVADREEACEEEAAEEEQLEDDALVDPDPEPHHDARLLQKEQAQEQTPGQQEQAAAGSAGTAASTGSLSANAIPRAKATVILDVGGKDYVVPHVRKKLEKPSEDEKQPDVSSRSKKPDQEKKAKKEKKEKGKKEKKDKKSKKEKKNKKHKKEKKDAKKKKKGKAGKDKADEQKDKPGGKGSKRKSKDDAVMDKPEKGKDIKALRESLKKAAPKGSAAKAKPKAKAKGKAAATAEAAVADQGKGAAATPKPKPLQLQGADWNKGLAELFLPNKKTG